MNNEIDYHELYQAFHKDMQSEILFHSKYFEQYIYRWLNNIDRSTPVLDLGCGVGFFLEALKNAGFSKRFGVDICPSQIAACRKLGNCAEHITDSFEYLSSKTSQFGAIVMIDVFEHLPVKRLVEFGILLRKSLNSGGYLLIRVPNSDSPMAARMRYVDITHTTSFTAESMSFILKTAGFSIIEIANEPPYLNKPANFHRHIRSSLRYIAYSLLRNFFYFWRRLEITAYCGHEKGFSTPISPNMIILARTTKQ